MINFRTDMADERFNICHKNKDIDGIESINKKITERLSVNKILVKNEKGSSAIQKKIGTYVTINIQDVNIVDNDELELIKDTFCKELKKFINNKKSIFVVGLGNEDSTADSIGPKVVKNLEITRHILKYEPELLKKGTKELCALAPGVLGTTGIETQEIIDSVAKKVNVDALIVIDALSTNNIGRLLKSIQITDTGICPGAGVENKRKEISKETLGIPVIAIGVPTVVEVSTIVANTLELLTKKFKEFEFLKDATYNDEYKIIKDVLSPTHFNLAVMPKEIDELVDNLKNIISCGINSII